MAQRPLAGKGRGARLALTLLLTLLLGACAGSGGNVQRAGDSRIAGNWITVERGDTLGAIARRAGVPLERLTRFNPGVDARRLAVGQRLLVPTHQERAPRGGPYRYQIRPGDTYAAIARRFGTTPTTIQRANPGVAPTQLRIGQVIAVPLRAATRAPNSATARTPPTRRTARPTPRPTSPAPSDSSLPASARDWPWPLDDYRLVRRFGTDSRGTLQPMLLATQQGATAKAVADGEVRFAGSMRQLGRVVIVHHAGNLQSVYALCETPLVEAGRRVTRGTPLCRVGRSAATGRHDLLFDLRLGGKPIDPQRVLR